MNDIIISIEHPEVTIQVEKPDITIEMPGSQGMQGISGDSAYQIALDNGFIGTEADWLASLELEGQFDSYPQDLALEYWVAKNI